MKNLVIVGGYGNIGMDVARRLRAPPENRPVFLAGRNADKARRSAARVGALPLVLDLDDPHSWSLPEGGGVVLACVDHTDASFARFALDHGFDYVDITASDPLLRDLEQLDALARKRGRKALLSVGFAPGLTNLLAARCVEGSATEDPMHIALRLGLGEVHGPAAFAWTLAAMEPGARPEPVRFGKRRALGVRVAFADQFIVQRTLHVPDVHTTLTVENGLWTGLFWLAAPLLRRWPRLAARLSARGSGLPLFSDRCGIRVSSGPRVAGYEGRHEGGVTAMMAAFASTRVADCAPGVHHLHQVADLDDLAECLTEAGGRLWSHR